MTKPAGVDDEVLEDLPPLDGESEDTQEVSEPLELPRSDPDESVDDAADPRGTQTDADELEDLDSEESWLNEAADAQDLDIGDSEVGDPKDGPSLGGDDEPAVGTDDAVEEQLGSGDSELDAGDEGPLDPDEELQEQDLPALDADEHGQPEDGPFVEDGFGADHPVGVPWATDPWGRVGAPLALSAVAAFACTRRGALVVCRSAKQLIQVDLEGDERQLAASGWDGGDVEALACDSAAGDERFATVSMVLKGGRLLISPDGGGHFASDPHGLPVADCVVCSGRIWVQTRSGHLATWSEGSLVRCETPGRVLAITRDTASGGLVALVRGDGGQPAAIVRGRPDGTLSSEPADGPELRSSTFLAAHGPHIAYYAREGVVRRGPAAAGPVRWEGCVTALCFVDDAGCLLAATYVDADDTTALVHLDSARRATVVARLGAARDSADSDARVLRLECDLTRGVVWAAGGFGVAAYAIASRNAAARD
jgi:hypothetical protein